MTNIKSKREVEDINRRVYANKTFAELKKIGKKKDLLNVDHYKKADRNKLIDRLVKGKQLTDESKNVLLAKAKEEGLKVNENMSKQVILQKITNPELKDFNKLRLQKLADEKGIPLRPHLSDKQIIQRLNNPEAYYTIESLKRVARSNNIEVRRNISKPDLVNILSERNLITTTPIQAKEANLWVSVKNIPETLRRATKKKPRNAREAANDFIQYIKNLKKDYITPSRLKKLSKQLEKKIKKAKEEEKQQFTPIKEKSAFKDFTAQYVIKGDPTYGPTEFLKVAKPYLINIMTSKHNIKARLYLNCLMKRSDSDGFTTIKKFAFHSIDTKLIIEAIDPNEIYQEMKDEIEEEIQKVEQAEGSGWVFLEVENVTLHISIWNPLNAGSYIDLPKELKNKKALINMQNEDNKCFLWCVLRALNPKDRDAERIDKNLKNKENTLNMDGITYPVDFRGINKFERQNPDISISVLGYSKDEKVYPLRISKINKNCKHQIALLLIKDGENSHYCFVKNMSALLRTQYNNHKGKREYCFNCFNSFNSVEALNKHLEYCNLYECVKLTMPEPNTYLKFDKFLNSEKAPFVIYADFECLNIPIHNNTPDKNKSYTNKLTKHEPVSFNYYIKSFNENVYKSKSRTYIKEEEEDPDVIDVFINWLEEDVKEIANLGNEKMIFTNEDEEQFNKASNCWICGKLLNLGIGYGIIAILQVDTGEPHIINVI